jgi:hypothetical protein
MIFLRRDTLAGLSPEFDGGTFQETRHRVVPNSAVHFASSEAFDILVGPWIEQLAEDKFRVSLYYRMLEPTH